MAGKFVVSKGTDGKSYFKLVAGNGEATFQSQGYATKASCANGIESVRKNSGDPKRFECKTAKDGPTFVIRSSNGQEIGRSQMYKSDSGCRNGMKSVARNAADTKVVEAG